MKIQGATAPETDVSKHVAEMALVFGNQFLRRDNKFYDIAHLGSPLSRNDVEMMILNRIKEEHPEVQLTPDLLKQLYKCLIEARHTDTSRAIQVWNGMTICAPGNRSRLIFSRGAAATNAWSEPEYRSLKINAADFGIVEDFFDAFFQRNEEKEQFLNWLTWSLRHEDEKPSWAPFFFSRGKGTGKSTTCRILSELFGLQNTAVQNNLDKLTQQFNSTVLTSKLIISEETQLRPGSTQGNAIKTYITEPLVLVERKGLEAERTQQYCCFVFTSNFPPTWMEEGERRYLVIEVDHDGRSGGPLATQFSSLVGQVHAFLDEPANVARLYNAIVRRELPATFNAKSLNIAEHSTPFMRRLNQTNRQTIVDQLEELLNLRELVVLPEADVVHFVRKNLSGSINQTKHLMDDLEWQKSKVKWGGKNFGRAIWVKPGYMIDNGKIYGPDLEGERVTDYLERQESLIDLML